MNEAEERERERLERVAQNQVDAAPVVEALRSHGFAVESVADLFNQKLDYRDAIAILLDWLPRVRNPDVKEDMVRALAVKWARKTAAPRWLLAEFEQADDATGTGLRWAVANALEVLASDEIADGMIALATDRGYGKAREMIVLGLGKLKDPRVPEVLVGLLADDEVVGHAVMALGKLRARSARSYLQPLLDHPRAWIRKEVKKAIERIERGR